jgi:hypothetical protein
MSNDERFVNRRGRQVLTSQELGTIRLDDEPEEKVTPKAVERAARHRTRRHIRLKRWQAGIFLGVVVLVLAAPVLIGEYLRGDYDASARDAKQRVQAIAAGTAKTQQNNPKLIAKDMNSVVQQVGVIRDGMCKGDFFDNLAGLYPRAAEALKRCSVAREKVASLARELSTMQQQKAYLEELQQITTALAPSSDEQFANLAAAQEKWSVAAEQIKQLNPPTSFREIHTKTATLSASLASEWVKLNNANSAQDTAAFRTAEEALTKDYEAFRALMGEYQQAIAATQQRLTGAYTKL